MRKRVLKSIAAYAVAAVTALSTIAGAMPAMAAGEAVQKLVLNGVIPR